MSVLMTSCEFYDDIAAKAREVNRYEVAALNLSKENRQLKAEIVGLEYKVRELEAKNKFLKFDTEKLKRSPSSFAEPVVKGNDLVKFATFNWSDKDLLKIAKTELKKKNFLKAAQYFYTLLEKYPNSSLINDEVLFETGMSAYESGEYYDWARTSLTRLIKEYPSSKYYRGAKLWRALAYYKRGRTDQFYKTVEEFRLKYRNTPEWKILSKHYEELTHRFKN